MRSRSKGAGMALAKNAKALKWVPKYGARVGGNAEVLKGLAKSRPSATSALCYGRGRVNIASVKSRPAPIAQNRFGPSKLKFQCLSVPGASLTPRA